jgi:LytS/YehU family sensor histidine kinase
VTLSSELSIIGNYLDLEQLRFGNRLSYSINKPDQAEQVLFPPLVLQTLVENSIKHGIAKDVEGGHIEVKITEQNKGYYLQVTSPGKLNVIKSGEGTTGLENTISRLDLLYGLKHGFKLEENRGLVSASFWFSSGRSESDK